MHIDESMAERTNSEWISQLQGDPDEGALADVRALLVRGLAAALGSRGELHEADFEDFAQDALLKILASLHSFRGESRFTTWAQKIAVRVALTELRRKRWKDWSLDTLIESPDGEARAPFMPALMTDGTAGPEKQAIQQSMIDIVRRSIDDKLTERQRMVLVAAIVHDVPLGEIATRLDTNRNALYKLMHDARKRLKVALEESGVTSDEVLTVFGEV